MVCGIPTVCHLHFAHCAYGLCSGLFCSPPSPSTVSIAYVHFSLLQILQMIRMLPDTKKNHDSSNICNRLRVKAGPLCAVVCFRCGNICYKTTKDWSESFLGLLPVNLLTVRHVSPNKVTCSAFQSDA